MYIYVSVFICCVWIHTTSIFTQCTHIHTLLSARWPPEVPSNPNYSITCTQHITKASKIKKIFLFSFYPEELKHNSSSLGSLPKSHWNLTKKSISVCLTLTNTFQLSFRSRMEGKKADTASRQHSNLLYKGHVITMAPYQPGKEKLCSFPDTTGETNG